MTDGSPGCHQTVRLVEMANLATPAASALPAPMFSHSGRKMAANCPSWFV